MVHDDNESEGGVATSSRTDTPKMFKVVLLNDDFTPMDFVVYVLRRFFAKSDDAAAAIMLAVHHHGRGIAGVYTQEIAETKAMQVNQFSKQNKYPLKSIVESE